MTDYKTFYFQDSKMHTNSLGVRLLNMPILNKGTAFSIEERHTFKLTGLLPPHVDTLEEQVTRAYEAYQMIDQDLERHVYLRGLQDQNETLFYRLVLDHIEEMLPMIYTPVVGAACQQFSEIYRRPRGLFISYPQKDIIEEVLENAPKNQVKVIVVTDGERILGLGDQGAGGLGIPIGKLSLYTACAGIDPSTTLPIVLDVGTNNKKLHELPTYIGWRHDRITGDQYYEFVDAFVQAVKKKFPNVLLQFEDFAQPHAYPLLGKYRDELCTFNDDIQGTASVCVGALLAAVKVIGDTPANQRVVVVGSGSAGCGISELLIKALVHHGVTEKEARSRFFMIDRNGLVMDDMQGLMPFQQALAQTRDQVSDWKIKDPSNISLLETIVNAKPTILLGVSAQPNLFTQEVVESMHKEVARPIIFPMSNPTSRCEAKPEDILKWTKGAAVVATGSPFQPVKLDGKTYVISQSNNCYVFPGMGLAVFAGKIKRVTDKMFMAASIALSEMSPALGKEGAPLLPNLSEIREVSKAIAFAVVKQAIAEGHADKMSDSEIQAAIEKTVWTPQYHKMVFDQS